MEPRIVRIPAFMLEFPSILALYLAANTAWVLFRKGWKAVGGVLEDSRQHYYTGSNMTVTFTSTVDFGHNIRRLLKEKNQASLRWFDMVEVTCM